MGIPVYFKTIVKEYEDIILKKDKLKQCNALFLDLNCAIHPCCQGETDESIMIQKIVDKIESLVEYTGVSDLLYIAIDGIPPKGKMKQQRMRRHKSILEGKPWDTNAITPGTYFMQKLNERLGLFECKGVAELIVSDSSERGEGEHKILQYIKHNNVLNSVIYGLDADLIMLSIVSKKDNIFLLRERTEYNIENTENEYIYLIIDELKRFIKKDICNIDDYIFICFFLGNDFINHLTSLGLRYGGYDILIDTYKLLQERYCGHFRLIDTNLEHCIHLTFLKEFLNELSSRESHLIDKTKKIRERQYKITYSKYHDHFNDFKKKYPNNEYIKLDDMNDYQNDSEHDLEERAEMFTNLPILYFPEEKNHRVKKDINLCTDYLNSLIWTSHYYFKECINWRWCTLYEDTPSLRDLTNYISTLRDISFEQDQSEYTIEDLLVFIFPRESHKLHKYNIKGAKYKLKIKPYHYRYLWECPIIFELCE